MKDEPGAPNVVDRNTFEAELDALRVREKARTRKGDAHCFEHFAVLLACGVLRHEAVDLDFGHIQHREEHWAIVDLKGKAGHSSTVPMPTWVTGSVSLSYGADSRASYLSVEGQSVTIRRVEYEIESKATSYCTQGCPMLRGYPGF